MLLFLIKLLSVLEMNLTLKAKALLKVLKIQHPENGFESYMKRIRISIPESSKKFARARRFESLMDRISIPECLRKSARTNEFESNLNRIRSLIPKGVLEGMDSNLLDYGFESPSEDVKKLEIKAKGFESL